MVNCYKLVALPYDYKDLILQKRNVQCGKYVFTTENVPIFLLPTVQIY